MTSLAPYSNPGQTPFMRVVWDVLEAAKDNQDETVIAACRRLINANVIGLRKHGRPEDKALVHEFADGLHDAECF
jgi:hypothetical protein